jgi:hypothetical protein
MGTDPTNIGNVLLRLGAVTPDRLVAAIDRQKHPRPPEGDGADRRLGAVLVALQLITPADLEYALRVQVELRNRNALDAELLLQQYQAERLTRSVERSRGSTARALQLLRVA